MCYTPYMTFPFYYDPLGPYHPSQALRCAFEFLGNIEADTWPEAMQKAHVAFPQYEEIFCILEAKTAQMKKASGESEQSASQT